MAYQVRFQAGSYSDYGHGDVYENFPPISGEILVWHRGSYDEYVFQVEHKSLIFKSGIRWQFMRIRNVEDIPYGRV